MSGFVLHPAALADLTEIWEYLAADNPAAARTPPPRHFERSKPTPFPFTFALANVSACEERNLSALLAPFVFIP